MEIKLEQSLVILVGLFMPVEDQKYCNSICRRFQTNAESGYQVKNKKIEAEIIESALQELSRIQELNQELFDTKQRNVTIPWVLLK